MAVGTDPKTYRLNHQMIRVKDPKESVSWYEDNLGLKLLRKAEMPQAKFDLYFLGYDHANGPSRGKNVLSREGLIELTHNYGTEDDPGYTVSNGNEAPHLGFGFFCISVDNLPAACARLEKNGVKFQEQWNQGPNHAEATVLDPNGYHVKLIGQSENDASVKETDLSTYQMNHTMIRVKDLEKSVKYYRDTLGMSLFRKANLDGIGATVATLGYPGDQGDVSESASIVSREGMVQLYQVHGTEEKEGYVYHNGNDQPQGFGHLCVSVDDLEAACSRWEELNVDWKKKVHEGRMKNIAFLLDPDRYWIEIVAKGAPDP